MSKDLKIGLLCGGLFLFWILSAAACAVAWSYARNRASNRASSPQETSKAQAGPNVQPISGAAPASGAAPIVFFDEMMKDSGNPIAFERWTGRQIIVKPFPVLLDGPTKTPVTTSVVEKRGNRFALSMPIQGLLCLLSPEGCRQAEQGLSKWNDYPLVGRMKGRESVPLAASSADARLPYLIVLTDCQFQATPDREIQNERSKGRKNDPRGMTEKGWGRGWDWTLEDIRERMTIRARGTK